MKKYMQGMDAKTGKELEGLEHLKREFWIKGE